MNRYPLFSANNLPAYGMVLLIWVVASILLAMILRVMAANCLGWVSALIFSGAGVMCGMAIMFGNSVLNLRKLRPGFERLANGERDPAIPSVWCPVLTMATRSAIDLIDSVGTGGDQAGGRMQAKPDTTARGQVNA